MAKNKAKEVKGQENTPVEAPAVEAPAAEAATVGGLRGPKDVSLDAVITLKVSENPKRPGSKAHDRFAAYADGMTVKAALEAGITTPDLVYDSAHGFIEIAGYDPKQKFVPKAKAPKEPKETKKGKAAKAAAEEDVGEEESV